jgi:hypothetical protein
MAARNFAAGVQMTMSSVIENYLRWFRLHQAKKDIAAGVRRGSGLGLDFSPEWTLQSMFESQQEDETEFDSEFDQDLLDQTQTHRFNRKRTGIQPR